MAKSKGKVEPGVIEGPYKGPYGIVPKDMVMIPLVDGEDIYVTKEEFEELGRQGAIEKYAACFVRERLRQQEKQPGRVK